MRYLIFLLFCSCNFIPAIAPDDFVYHPPQPIQQDTCVTPVEFTEPKFVTGYFVYDEPLFTDRLFIVGDQEAWIYPDNVDDLQDTLLAMLQAWKPQFQYQVFVNPSDSRQITLIAKGTNDRYEFMPYIKIKFNGLTAGFGWHTQGFTFLKAVNAEQYGTLVSEFPSVDYFTFIGSDYDSTDYVSISYRILGDCKLGRHTADFRYMPYEMPDTLINLFIEAGWENVLQ